MKALVKWTDELLNLFFLGIVLLMLAFSGYAIWDFRQVHRDADSANYAAYKPSETGGEATFGELTALNGEVIAWLTVFGTNIDYPVAQAGDNMKYVNTGADGRYSLSGSVFLDYRNSADFSDFNSILYGHNMDRKTMFGEIGNFAREDFFAENGRGELYFGGEKHGIEFFAMLRADAYDGGLFLPNVAEEEREGFLEGLGALALRFKDAGVSAEDRLIMLVTCSPSTTNGRDVLVGRLVPFEEENAESAVEAPEQREMLARPLHLFPALLKAILAAMLLARIAQESGATRRLP